MATPFKMKGHELPGPNQRKETPYRKETPSVPKSNITNKQRLENLLKVVPNEEAFNKLSKEDQKGFTDAWIKSKGVTKQVTRVKKVATEKKSPAKDFGIVSGPLIAAGISAAAAATKGAIDKAQAKKAAKKKAGEDKKREATSKQVEAASTDMGAKSKITE